MDLRELTEEYLGFIPESYVEREIKIAPSPDITAIVGPRRAGKSFFLMLEARRLLNAGKQVVYLLMDDPDLKGMPVRKLAELVRRAYPSGEVYLFLDEVQEWENWDWNLRWLHEVKDFRIFVSGSSYVLQESEIPSRLRGRYRSFLLLPFSFREVSRGRSFREIGKLWEDWLKWGGYPEVWLFRSREKLVSIFRTMMIRDVVERHGVEDLEVFERVARFLLDNYANAITLRSLSRLLRYEGIEVSVKTLGNYIKYMEEGFMLFVVERLTYSSRLRLVSPRKVYLPDHGLARLSTKLDRGRLLENIVFLDLLRRGERPKYYVTKRGEEVDFVTERHIIEVSLEPDVEHLKKLERAARELGRTPVYITLEESPHSISIIDFLRRPLSEPF